MNLKALYLPDIAVHRRIRWIKNIVVMGLFASLLVSWRLWTGERLFPHVPAFRSFPVPGGLIETALFGCMLLLALLSALGRKPGLFIFLLLALTAFMVCADINRMQPWLFQYVLLLFLLLFYNWRVDEPREHTPVFNSLRICLVLVYLWDGIHKINSGFFNETWPWMMSVFENALPHKAVLFLSRGAYVVPAAELLAALSLFVPTLRRIGIPVLMLLHLINLACLGPLGKNYNAALWPWHICMLLLLYAAFAGKTASRFHHFSYTLRYRPFFPAAVLTGLLPLLGFSQGWNVVFFSDFNPRPHNKARIELTAQAAERLPLYIAAFAHEANGKKELDIKSWSMHELRVQAYPALPVYRAVEEQLKKITCCPQDVNLRLKEKSPVIASL